MNKTLRHSFVALALLALSTLNSQLSTALADPDPSNSVPFTYQGQLQNNGLPASGTYNFTFTLFNAGTGGAYDGPGPHTNNGVIVSNGLFTVLIDFGASVWNGTTNWLEVAVETNGASPFTTLAPRQHITPVPYAIFASTASNLIGTVQNSSLPANPIFSGTVTATSFSGSAAGLTGIPAGHQGPQGPKGPAGSSGPAIGAEQGSAIDPSTTDGFVGGGNNNTIKANSPNAAIVGGNNNTIQFNNLNSVIGGGDSNTNNHDAGWSVIAGGNGNQVSSGWGAVGGGGGNVISNNAPFSVIAGGQNNAVQANAQNSFIGGGNGNSAGGQYSTVPGGSQNQARGNYSFAAGQNAQATNTGSFVWSDDSSSSPFASTNNNSFNVRAAGGVRLVTSGTGVTVDGHPVLTSVSPVPASSLTGTVVNNQLANSSITINAGTGLSGGGAVALGGSITLRRR